MKSWLPLLLSVFLLSACATQGGNTGISLLDAPGSKEKLLTKLEPGKFSPSLVSIGSEKDLAQRRGEGLGLVRSQAIEGYLGGILARLIAASGITQVPGKVVLQASQDFGASATADGNIYIAMGWIPYLESEDEIAAIIAHELGHVLLKHHTTDIIGKTQKRLQSSHELALGARTALQKVQIGASDQRAMLGMQALVELIDKVVMPAWNRRQEAEADLLGTDLLIAAGYSPEGMTSMLEKRQAWEKLHMESDAEFQKRLMQLAAKDISAAINTSINKVIADISVAHPDTESRLDNLAQYIDRFYANAAFPSVNAAAFKKLRAQRTAATVLRNYDMAFSARSLFAKGQIKTAYGYAKESATGPTAQHAYPNWILAKSASQLGLHAQANAALERALSSEEPVREIYTEMIEVQERAGNNQAALKWIDKAANAFGDSPVWAPHRIRVLKKLGRKNDATALALKCSVDTPELRRDCQAASAN